MASAAALARSTARSQPERIGSRVQPDLAAQQRTGIAVLRIVLGLGWVRWSYDTPGWRERLHHQRARADESPRQLEDEPRLLAGVKDAQWGLRRRQQKYTRIHLPQRALSGASPPARARRAERAESD